MHPNLPKPRSCSPLQRGDRRGEIFGRGGGRHSPGVPAPRKESEAQAAQSEPSAAGGVCGLLADGHHQNRRIWGHTYAPVTVVRRDRWKGASSRGEHAEESMAAFVSAPIPSADFAAGNSVVAIGWRE